jgi:hypothetical protein
MNKFALVAAAALSVAAFGAAAIAQESSTSEAGDFDNVDANKNEMVSWDEALGVYPTLSQVIFDQADMNDDGSLDESEYTSLEGLTAGLDDDGAGDNASDDSSSSGDDTSSSSEGDNSSSSEDATSSSSDNNQASSSAM